MPGAPRAQSPVPQRLPFRALYPRTGLHLPLCPRICAGVSGAAHSLRFRSWHRAPVLPPRACNCQQALPPSPRSCPAVPHAQSPAQHAPPSPCSCPGAPRAQSPSPQRLPFRALYPRTGLHLPQCPRICAVVSVAARSLCFRPSIACRSPSARNRRQALPPSPHPCPGAPRVQSPAGTAAKPVPMPRRPTRVVARELVLTQNPRLCVLPFRALRASFRITCALSMRGFASAAVSAHLRCRFRGCAFPALSFPASCTGAFAPRA